MSTHEGTTMHPRADVIIEVHVETYLNIYEPINVHSISQKLLTKHDSRNFFPWHHGIMTNLVKLIRLEQVEMPLPWWTKNT